jgi:TolA-binding protein
LKNNFVAKLPAIRTTRRTTMIKMKFWMHAIVPFVFLILFTAGCGEGAKPEAEKTGAPETSVKEQPAVSAEDIRHETKEALETAREYTLQQKEAYQKKMETKLEELDTRIDKMKAEARESTEETKASIEKKVKELEAKRDAATKKLDEIKKSSVEKWENLKSDMDSLMNDLEKKIKTIFPAFE